jgi:hypothetical protein
MPVSSKYGLALARRTRSSPASTAGTREGNIARDQFHPLAFDQAGQEPGEPEAST